MSHVIAIYINTEIDNRLLKKYIYKGNLNREQSLYKFEIGLEEH